MDEGYDYSSFICDFVMVTFSEKGFRALRTLIIDPNTFVNVYCYLMMYWIDLLSKK